MFVIKKKLIIIVCCLIFANTIILISCKSVPSNNSSSISSNVSVLNESSYVLDQMNSKEVNNIIENSSSLYVSSSDVYSETPNSSNIGTVIGAVSTIPPSASQYIPLPGDTGTVNFNKTISCSDMKITFVDGIATNTGFTLRITLTNLSTSEAKLALTQSKLIINGNSSSFTVPIGSDVVAGNSFTFNMPVNGVQSEFTLNISYTFDDGTQASTILNLK